MADADVPVLACDLDAHRLHGTPLPERGYLLPHECRHTFASGLIARGRHDLLEVAAYAGHSKPSFTLDRYGHHAPKGNGHQEGERMKAATRGHATGSTSSMCGPQSPTYPDRYEPR